MRSRNQITVSQTLNAEVRQCLARDRAIALVPVAAWLGLGLPALALGAALLWLPRTLGAKALGLPATLLALYLVSSAGVLATTALVLAANDQLDGHHPSVRTALGGALRRWRLVLAWSGVAATAGLVLRAIENSVPARAILGRLTDVVGDTAWTAASFFAVPVMVSEGLGPLAALRRSTQLMRSDWAQALRSEGRFVIRNVLILMALLVAVAVAVFLAVAVGPVAAVVLVGLGVVCLTAALSYFSASQVYLRVLLYRHATGLPLTGLGIDLDQHVGRR